MTAPGRKAMAKEEKRTSIQVSMSPIEKELITEITKGIKKSHFIMKLVHESPEFIKAATRRDIDIKSLKVTKMIRGTTLERKWACNFKETDDFDTCSICAYANEKAADIKSSDTTCGLHKFPWKVNYVCDEFEISEIFKK